MISSRKDDEDQPRQIGFRMNRDQDEERRPIGFRMQPPADRCPTCRQPRHRRMGGDSTGVAEG